MSITVTTDKWKYNIYHAGLWHWIIIYMVCIINKITKQKVKGKHSLLIYLSQEIHRHNWLNTRMDEHLYLLHFNNLHGHLRLVQKY